MPVSGKLTDEQKAEIRRLRALGMTEFQIAIKFGVYPNAIRRALGKPQAKASAR